MFASLKIFRAKTKVFGERYRKPIFCLALIAFIIGLIITGQSLDFKAKDISFGPLLCVVFITQPLLILLNSFELKLCGHAVGVNLNLRDSIFVSSSATIANILPLPAGLLVRGGALTQRGGNIGQVSMVLLAAGLMWMSVALTVSGAVLSGGQVGTLVLCHGAVVTIGLMVFINRLSNVQTALGFFVVRFLMVALLTIQLKLCFSALGHVITLRGSAVYVVSGVAGAVVSIVPAGLGIIEGFGAMLAKLDGASPALAYIVLSLSRFIGLSLAALTMLIFAKNFLSPKQV